MARDKMPPSFQGGRGAGKAGRVGWLVELKGVSKIGQRRRMEKKKRQAYFFQMCTYFTSKKFLGFPI